MLFIFVFSWQSLFNGVDNKFYEQFENGSTSYSDFDRGRYDNIISVQPPRTGFNYGQNYIFKTTFVAGENIEKSYIQLVSEDHSKIFVNGNKIPTMYGALYYFRHSSKRRDYDYGIQKINISKFLKKGNNELIIWNNLSAPVHPVGIGIKITNRFNNGSTSVIRSNDLKWKVFRAKSDGKSLSPELEIGYQILEKDDISMDRHFIHPLHVKDLFKNLEFYFVEPALFLDDPIYKQIEFWFFLVFSLFGLCYFLISQKEKTVSKFF
jgi:hypothetical protein